MRMLSDINEALYELKNGEILTTSSKDQIVYKREKVFFYNNGSSYNLSVDDFLELYSKNHFYIYEDDAEIDEDKDEAYYRYYRK